MSRYWAFTVVLVGIAKINLYGMVWRPSWIYSQKTKKNCLVSRSFIWSEATFMPNLTILLQSVGYLTLGRALILVITIYCSPEIKHKRNMPSTNSQANRMWHTSSKLSLEVLLRGQRNEQGKYLWRVTHFIFNLFFSSLSKKKKKKSSTRIYILYIYWYIQTQI